MDRPGVRVIVIRRVVEMVAWHGVRSKRVIELYLSLLGVGFRSTRCR